MMFISIILNVLRLLFIYCLLPIIIIFLLFGIVKIISDYSKYGKKIFDSFKIRDISNARDEILLITLEKISWYKKIIKPKKLKSNYIMVDGNGINIYKIFTTVGLFDGDEKSKYLYYKTNGRDARITNPMLSLMSDEKILKSMFPKIIINKYLVVTDGTFMKQKTSVNVVNYSNALYAISEGSKYNENEINKIAKKINTM